MPWQAGMALRGRLAACQHMLVFLETQNATNHDLQSCIWNLDGGRQGYAATHWTGGMDLKLVAVRSFYTATATLNRRQAWPKSPTQAPYQKQPVPPLFVTVHGLQLYARRQA